MRWSELLEAGGLRRGDDGRHGGWALPGASVAPDPVISSIVEDSREAGPGACFVAVRGRTADGHGFVAAALRQGASGIVSEMGGAVPELPASVAHVQLPSTRGIAGRLAAVLYGLDRRQRAGQFKVVGITGTNGKSTFCFLLRSILQHAGCPSALLGTIEYDLLSRRIPATLTTPPATTLIAHLAEAARAGASHAVMEVSSIALDQGRCAGIRFDVGVFSNLTGDHLDYHGDMAAYLRAKKRLFDELEPQAAAVVNAEDPAGEQVIADCRAGVIRYAVLGGSNGGGKDSPKTGCEEGFSHQQDSLTARCEEGFSHQQAGHGEGDDRLAATRRGTRSRGSLLAQILEMTAQGTRFTLTFEGSRSVSAGDAFTTAGSIAVGSALIGRHNVQNCLAAAGAAIALGIPLETIAAGLAAVRVVPGRLQPVLPAGGSGHSRRSAPTVLVDYAHTDDALANVLSAVRPLTPGQLIVLFGCGGDRDTSKRPRMAKVVGRWADRIVVTSDNPRTEDPAAIIRDILVGFVPEQLPRVSVEPDRRRAIAAAVAMAGPGDLVLLAGKGHEDYQIIGRERLPFDDAKIAAELLAAASGRAGR